MSRNSNIFSLPFRRTTNVALSQAIKQYISSKYNQHPDMFAEDLVAIDRLRHNAVQVREPHLSGAQKIIAYAGQLVWIGRKFPLDLGVDFAWYPALGYNLEIPIVLNNLKFELANILYNLAALYSQLAVSSSRSTTEGLKMACNYFCLAAGVIRHINENIVPDLKLNPPEDMDEMTLECLQQLLLAQAQECFWQKAVVDGYRDASIARLAAKTSDFYGVAGDWAVKSDAISSELIHHTIAKHHHFAAAAQYRQAFDCLEKRKYGEEIARLRDSFICVQEGLKEARYLNKYVLEDLNSLKNKVSEDLRKAEKDNDLIYLCPVPPKSELKNLERANMATFKVPLEISEPLSFMGHDKKLGPSLFAKLVPFSVHIAESIYEERQDRLINTKIITPLQNLISKAHSTLSSLSLPGSLQAIEKPLGLPHTLSSHAQEIRQSDAIGCLKRSFSEISKLAQSASSIYSEARFNLLSEGEENERLKLRYGTDRWTRLDSVQAAPKLHSQLDEIDGYLKTGAKSDHVIISKFEDCENLLHILSSDDSEISKFVPQSNFVSISPRLEEKVLELRSILNKLSRMESKWRKKIDMTLEMVKKDDINVAILVEAARLELAYPAQEIVPAHFEDFCEKRLSKYDSEILALQAEEEEQDYILRQLTICNESFLNNRKEDITGQRERENALQALENAYFKYKEIIDNLEGARKFYNELNLMVKIFRDEVKAWVSERQKNAERLENELNTFQSAAPVPHSQPQAQKEKIDFSISNIYHNQQDPSPNVRASDQVHHRPQLASIPTQVSDRPEVALWSPEMGIKFSGTSNRLDPSSKVPSSDTIICGGNNRKLSTENIPLEDALNNFDINSGSTTSNQTWDPRRGLHFAQGA
ncbi:pH-response regulator protein palA/RIM20 [Podosphaera aphanis]|nr:pH-response regulator protein palA/RIM20 [Podosphaera aphanis]